MISLRYVPKVELHCHVDGIVDPPMLRDLQRQGVVLPVTPEALQAAYPVRSFDAFIRWFQVADAVEDDTDYFRPILAQHIQRLKAQGVVYTEIMLGTSELPKDDGHLIEEFGQFRDYVSGLEGGTIQVEFLVALARGRPVEWVEQVADRLLRLRKADLLFGVALAGWPETPVRGLARPLARLREGGLGIEVHAGEWAGPESVWDALEYGHPHRIGHGVAVFQDPRLIERVQRDGVHLEMCPTSNVKTGSVALIQDHPVRLARELGLSFSVSTDDPGPFESSMESEYALLADTFGFGEEDFALIAEQALAARFRQELRYLGGISPRRAGTIAQEEGRGGA